MTLDNNNVVLEDFLAIFLTLYFTTHLSWPHWLYFYCFFSLNILTPLMAMKPVILISL